MSELEVMTALPNPPTPHTPEAFFRERIFRPLGMKDTGFSVPPTEIDRLATCYRANPESKALEVYDAVGDDYRTFGQMLLDKGRHGSERVLAASSVEAMTSDQITPEQKAASELFPGFWRGRGWGFGMSLLPRRDDTAAVSARFGWDGGFGTSWCSDPEKGMVAILMIQRLGFPLTMQIHRDFWTAVDAAVSD